MKQTTLNSARQRKFLMVAPLLVLPFVTLLFWALGGGSAEATTIVQQKGINTELPNASFKDDKLLDKMAYYVEASQDSVKRRQLLRNDPNYFEDTLQDSLQSKYTSRPIRSYRDNTSGNEAKVYRKLDQLNAALNQATSPEMRLEAPEDERLGFSPSSAERDQLQGLDNSTGTDPEMEQINGMLEKILDIQNPGRMQEKLRQQSEAKRGQVFAVTTHKNPTPISGMDAEVPELVNVHQDAYAPNGFYSFDNNPAMADTQNAVQAVIHETQSVVNGSTVKLRLINDVYINGMLIPKNNFVFGTANLNGERLGIKINSIRYRNSLFPVELNVYDMDGLDGVYIPGAISRDVSKDAADRSMQNIGMTSLDPSWQMQAAGAGIEAAKTLFSKKVKLIRVTVKAGYKVLLMDEKQKLNNQ